MASMDFQSHELAIFNIWKLAIDRYINRRCPDSGMYDQFVAAYKFAYPKPTNKSVKEWLPLIGLQNLLRYDIQRRRK